MKHLMTLIIVQSLLISIDLYAQDCPPVQELKKLYSIDPELRTTIDKMLDNLHDLKDGTPNPWKNKNVDDLYSFLNEWFYFLPKAHDGLDRIIEFSFLYYKNPYGMKFVKEEPGVSWALSFIEARGKYMDSPASAGGVDTWLKDESINNQDYVLPDNGFQSFNDFFTRDLKPGAREVDAIDDPSGLVSPADGIINMIVNKLQMETEIPTKGQMTMSLTELLDNSKYAYRFVGGSALAVFLMPTNYHHYHAPISGTIVESKESVGSYLFGMPDILDMINNGNPGYNKDYSVFEDFKHGYFIIETDNYGLVGMVPIGLQTIGSVVFENKFKNLSEENQQKVYKGEKLGHFAYGGSTVLLIFEPGRFHAINVRQGQQIGNLNEK